MPAQKKKVATAAKTAAKSKRPASKPRAGAKQEFVTVKAACHAVLVQEGRPMHYQEITQKVAAGNFNLRTRGGKTPAASVRTELAINPSMFEKVSPGTFRAVS